MATVTLAETDKPNKKDMIKAAVSLIPQPPILIGKAIERSIIGAKTKKLIKSILRFNE